MRGSWLWFNAAAIWLVIFVAGVLLESRPAVERARRKPAKAR